MPKWWNILTIVPLYKGKNLPRTAASSYRGIAIMEQIAKLYAGVVYKRLESETEKRHLRADGQAGFRPGCRIEDNIMTLKLMEEIQKKLGVEGYTLFVDMEKAYDNVDRTILWTDLHKLLQGEEELIRDIQRMYEGLQARVQGTQGKLININKGVKQGCPCSPLIFGIFFEQAEPYINNWMRINVRKRNLGRDLFVRNKTPMFMLMFADDIAFSAKMREGLHWILTAF